MVLHRRILQLIAILALIVTSLGPTMAVPTSASPAAPASATITTYILSCSSFTARGTADPATGYAAVRVWKNSTSGTPLVDSYINNGVPTRYAPIQPGGVYNLSVSFAPQLAGTKLVARIYRASNAAFSSWDDATYQDVTVNCSTAGGALVLGSTLTCSNFAAVGIAAPASGYAAVRVWKNAVGGTPLVDSYVNNGVPTLYTAIQSNGTYNTSIAFAPQPAGTKLVGRIYRAPAAAFGSWDIGTYQDVTVNCATTAGATIGANTLTCSSFTVSGTASPASGYAAVRVWKGSTGGTPLIDSYSSNGVPTLYAPIQANGSYNLSISFASQPAGTTLVGRIYRAPLATFGSWDSGTFQDVTVTCVTTPGATISASTLTCSNFTVSGTAAPSNGYAAVRVWKDSTSGTPLIDSYINNGVPSYYAPIQSNGSYSVSASFPAQPAGTKLVGRIYRAPANAFGSWDSGTFQDVTVTCVTTPGATISTSTLTCSNFTVSGTAVPPNGYAAVRVWKGSAGGTPLIDSYIDNGVPSFYAPINVDGTYDVSVSFPPQPIGTTLVGRIYRAPANAFGSWDGGTFQDVTATCLAHVWLPLINR